MKTTYPPNTATSPAEWQTYSNKHLNEWYMCINTERDNPNQLNYATIERQLVALRLKIQNCSIKQYYPLKGKIQKLEKQLKDQKSRQAWEDFLAR
jgi:hypothetical protein